MTVRPFAVTDAPAVSALIAETLCRSNAEDYALDRLEPLIAYFTPEKLIRLAAERVCLVAEDDGEKRVVGTASLDGAELATFFVLPEYKGQGAGTLLLDALETRARDHGLATITVAASLTGAPFYERRGYARTGEVADHWLGPQLVLAKRMDDGPRRELPARC